MPEQQANGAGGVEAEASALGWVPQDTFRGDPEKWVDAETFVERGRHVMPILRKNNEKLLADLSSLQGEVARLRAADAAKTTTISDLTKFQAEEVKRQVKAELDTLKFQKREAIKAGDHELAATLEERIDEVKEAAVTPAPAAAPAAAPTSQPEPWAQAFAVDNPWLGKDKRKTALFAAEADELFHAGMRGAALLEKAKAQMEAVLNPPSEPSPSKVEGGSRGAGGGGGTPRGKSFAD